MAKEKIQKTNAARLLDSKKIAYELIPYEVDENDLSAVHIATQLGEPIERVFDKEVDLKLAAKATGNKSCNLIPMKELLPLTGYIRGGCSPVGMKKQFPTFIHSTCKDFDFIYVSAGVRGLQFKINPDDLCKAAGAKVGDLIVMV